MSIVELLLPKMGESIMEAKVLKWLKKPGEKIALEESILEVATDKIDTEVPSVHAGIMVESLVVEGEMVQIGQPIARIETNVQKESIPTPTVSVQKPVEQYHNGNGHTIGTAETMNDRFYSPLVLNIAKEEKIPFSELERIPGTGKEGRVTKNDILAYVQHRQSVVNVVDNLQPVTQAYKTETIAPVSTPVEKKIELAQNTPISPVQKPAPSFSGAADIIEMDRMRKMISERMLESKRVSAHVTSFVEADVTNIVFWRNRMKTEYKEKEGTALTLTPIFIEALAKALKEFPSVNASVEGDYIIQKKDIHIGMAVALPNGNLVVPVIRNVDQLNLIGITKKVNDLAKRARNNELQPDELSGGTYSMSNMGSFGNVMGTPIIVQPQVAIMAFGAVVKKPAVIETPQGDQIGIRHMMFLSHTYDHRIIDGALGGMFVRKVADHLENFDINRKS